ncbi:MAG: hypothetical protein H8E48_08650 [Chloroflexi bacterium]|nr:hypothetical protein [Chloroflexota bacterium]
MQPQFEKDSWEKMGPFLVPLGRSIAGVVLGVVLSMIGIVIAWSLYVFFGGHTIEIWQASLFFSAGLGAGIATFVAWLHIDRENGWVLALTALVVLGAGILGAWGGYEYGAAQEVECCAMPTVSPVYYTALGSAVVANVAGVVFAATRAILTRKRPTQIQNSVN